MLIVEGMDVRGGKVMKRTSIVLLAAFIVAGSVFFGSKLALSLWTSMERVQSERSLARSEKNLDNAQQTEKTLGALTFDTKEDYDILTKAIDEIPTEKPIKRL